MYKKLTQGILMSWNGRIFLGVLLLGLLLRLYRFPELFYYTMDEEVMNLIQRNIVLGKHFPLIGSVSPLSTYLTPYFYYFGAFILWISKLNPLGQGIFAAILGTFNIGLIYYIGNKIFGRTIALFSSIIYSSSFLITIFDRRYWHLSLGPFLSLLVFLSLYKIKQGSVKYIYLLTSALIIGWSSDYTNIILFVYSFIFWVVFRLPVKRREILLAILIFVFSNLPLVLFDLRHDFLNTKSFITYFTRKHSLTAPDISGKTETGDRETLGNTKKDQAIQTAKLPFITLSRLFYINSNLNLNEQHTYCKEYIVQRNDSQGFWLPLLSVIILGDFLYLTLKTRIQSYRMVALFYIIFQAGVLFYAFVFKGDVFEHYLATLLPYFVFILAIVLFHLSKVVGIKIALVLLIIWAGLNINLLFRAYNPFGFQNKLQIADFALNAIGAEKFALDSLSSCFRWDGYYYPFILKGRHPEKSYQDPNYSWLYDYPVAENPPSKVVVVSAQGSLEKPSTFENYADYKRQAYLERQFGGIRVLLVETNRGPEDAK